MVEDNRPDVIYSVRLDSNEQPIEEDEIKIVDTTLKIQDDSNVEQDKKEDVTKKTLFEKITKTLLGRVITLNVAGIAGIIAYITVHATGNFKYICLQ